MYTQNQQPTHPVDGEHREDEYSDYVGDICPREWVKNQREYNKHAKNPGVST